MACRPGIANWEKYERLCEKILRYLFVPPLEGPLTRLRGEGGEKDLALFIPYDAPLFWQNIHRDYNASLVIIECKNLSRPVRKNDLAQLSSYLGATHGLFGLAVCRKHGKSASNAMKWLLREQRKLVLCIDDSKITEMVRLKESGIQPERVLDILRRDVLLSV